MIAVERLIAMPFAAGKAPAQRGLLRGERGRSHGAGQHVQAHTVGFRKRLQPRLNDFEKRFPGARLAPVQNALRAIGIPQLQHRSLREDVGCAEARRMRSIALDLGRTSHVALDQDAGGVAVARDRGREVQRFAFDESDRRFNVRDDLLRRRRAAARAGKRERGRHELHEIAPTIRKRGREPPRVSLRRLVGRGRLSKLGETAPEFRTMLLRPTLRSRFDDDRERSVTHWRHQRWQVEQLVSSAALRIA